MFKNYQSEKTTKLSGFTLLELLVVMAVISMLLSIMMPSLNQAKQIAKITVCQSNLRQFHLAWTMYADDYNFRMCHADTEWNGIRPWSGDYAGLSGDYIGHYWVSDGPGAPYNEFCGTEYAIKRGVLWPYVENLELYLCPSEQGPMPRTYAIASTMNSTKKAHWNFSRTTEIISPSQKAVFLDVKLFPRLPNGMFIGGFGQVGSMRPVDVVYKHLWGDIKHLTYRHNKGCNMSFADGHTEYWKWKDKRTMELMHTDSVSGQEMTAYSVDNQDIPPLLKAFEAIPTEVW